MDVGGDGRPNTEVPEAGCLMSEDKKRTEDRSGGVGYRFW